ncbi:unnamed protein product [Rotaria sp. Silwood2]|nr:unnamed protein product [Rotaria sp. Silwood2]
MIGFGSTACDPIRSAGVHYDCGCVISETGALVPFSTGSALSVPAVYIAYFATFGAMAWHLLLFDSSVQNLYHPILAKHAIDSTAVTEHMAGGSVRAKVCHFVRARLLSTYHFLSMQSNQDDACLLFSRCFELFAQFSRQRDENSWIKPIYKTIDEKLEAEKQFQSKIFYPTHKKLVDYKEIINIIQSQSPLQTKLHEHTTQMPILIEFIHFKTELCNPESIQLPLTILRRLLDSFDFLKITRYIYALSQFHILLHRTFTQLIEREEFLTITLKQLYERAQPISNSFHQRNQENKYYTIIENGIEAVNGYHKFADGQIRPGACDATQLFQTISMETPISYLVETDNYDEGDIIMRILSVLVDYHNNLLELLDMEIRQNGDTLGLGSLKDIICELSKREISILQIVQENMGVITLNKMDCHWIEELSRASLENEKDYFLKLNTRLKFNFLYVQSYLIRTYLLYCRINYQHIKGKYQCYTKRKIPTTTNNHKIDNDIDIDSNILLIDEWNHLEQKNLDQLQNEFNLLQRIMDILKHSSEDYSSMKLSEFIRNTNYDDRFAQQFQQYRIKDFSLSQIKSICQLYEQSINHFQHTFINVSHLIRVPLDKKLNNELDHILKSSFISSNDHTKKEEFQVAIRTITKFLNVLKDREDFLASQWAQSFTETCKYLCIENLIVKLIPKEIKCENYVPLCLKLIDIRSQLQERTFDIEEKTIHLWSARFDISNISQSNENSFQIFRNKNDDFLLVESKLISSLDDFSSPSFPQPTDITGDLIDWSDMFDNVIIPTEPLKSEHFLSQTINYTSLSKLKLTLISLSPSALFENSRKQAEQLATKVSNIRLVITCLDGKQEKYYCKPEKLYIQLKKLFDKKKYDLNTIGLIDPNQLLIDFMKTNINNSLPIIETEYYVIEKKLLFPIVLEFENNQWEYFATAEATITSLLSRFILDQQLKFTSPENYFSVFDSLGRYIAVDYQLNNIYRSNEQNPIHIRILRCNHDANICCEMTLMTGQEETHCQYFNPATTWKEISLWSKILGIKTEIPVDNYYFWNTEQKHIINEDEIISFTLSDAESINVDVLNEESVMDVMLSYDKNIQTIRILNSCPVHSLLSNPDYLKQLDLKISPQECTLVFVSNESEKQILKDLDMENPISHYASMTDKSVHFQISILIQIIQYDNQKEIPIPISHRNITIKELLGIIEINNDHTYLASYETKIILSENTKLSTINETKFFLIKEHQTCLVSIQQSEDVLMTVIEDNIQNQRYLINATINDIYKQNKNIDQNQYLLYDRDFVPSRDTPLSSFLFTKTSPIQFNLIYQKLQANVTVTSDEQKSSIKFQCEPTMTIGRVHQIVCQLWKLKTQLYRLSLLDDSIIDEEYSLDDLGESINDLQLKLISITNIKCEITYQDEILMISTTSETLLSSILKETLEKLLIPLDDIDRFELNLIDDPESPTNVDLDLSIDDIHLDYFTESNIIPFQLQKK